MATTKLSLAPLQGVTDYYFRNAFAHYFGGVDVAFAPYLRIQYGEVRKSLLHDIQPENNQMPVIPQLMTNSVEEFLFLAKMLEDLQYKEVNWNLGCPYPMVAKRKLGSGMLAFPELIESILDEVMPKINFKLSVKMRSGYETPDEFSKVLEMLNKYELSEIIFHPRYGKQLYKGSADVSLFGKALELSKHPLAYNGDITSLEFFANLQAQYPQTEHFMIGRALISNPFLAAELKGLPQVSNKKAVFKEFHNTLYQQFTEKLSGKGHLMSKMLALWEYFSLSFTNSHKVYKRIKKASNVARYNEAVSTIFREEDFL